MHVHNSNKPVPTNWFDVYFSSQFAILAQPPFMFISLVKINLTVFLYMFPFIFLKVNQ